ncbi:perlwapin-like isoform X2 [Kryptolebias marmoratus]|uniref:perlwapin-like isoform X2 n=1 Tax=Kryptolebias marmoratus TaxID=37003 RepID=UPI0018ACCAAD|nr:perlwapin-like isoform X2 [Kryptolebias marmoratus]
MKTSCSIIAALLLAFCLFVPVMPRHGCPPPGPGPCVEDCSTDRDCLSHQKCCSIGCGHQCIGPKPGSCGWLVSTYVCHKFCDDDYDCPEMKKCCPNSCSYSCKEPIHYDTS